MIVDINPVVGKYGNIIHSVESVHSYMYVSGHGRGGSRISIWGGGGRKRLCASTHIMNRTHFRQGSMQGPLKGPAALGLF